MTDSAYVRVERSEYLVTDGVMQIALGAKNPGRIQIFVDQASEKYIEYPNSPVPVAPTEQIQKKHKVELLPPMGSSPLTSDTFDWLPSLLTCHVPATTGIASGRPLWRARLTNLDEGFMFVVRMEYENEFDELVTQPEQAKRNGRNIHRSYSDQIG